MMRQHRVGRWMKKEMTEWVRTRLEEDSRVRRRKLIWLRLWDEIKGNFLSCE